MERHQCEAFFNEMETEELSMLSRLFVVARLLLRALLHLPSCPLCLSLPHLRSPLSLLLTLLLSSWMQRW